MKVLIVEDELLIAHASKIHLESNGFDVVGPAKDGNGFRKLLSSNPDVILMDVSLKKGENGIALTKEIRENGILTPVIFTTGNERSKTLEEVATINNAKVLSKPVVFKTLLESIKEVANELLD